MSQWLFVIAEKLHKTVAELLDSMDAEEFFGWIEYLTRPEIERKEKEIHDNSMAIKDMVSRAVHGARG